MKSHHLVLIINLIVFFCYAGLSISDGGRGAMLVGIFALCHAFISFILAIAFHLGRNSSVSRAFTLSGLLIALIGLSFCSM